MGTRGLISVKVGGETKIAQYGQWDFYFTGQGADIRNFLNYGNLDAFRNYLRHVEFVDQDYVDNKVKEMIGPDSNSVQYLVSNDNERFFKEHPEFSRDTGADILNLVASGRVNKVKDSSDFASDFLFCEYHYMIDVDDKTVRIEYGYPARKYLTLSFEEFCEPGRLEQLEEDGE